MSTMTYAGAAVEVDGEGFLQNPAEWTKEIAEAIAVENGIPSLTDRHWLVLHFMRNAYLSNGDAPTIRSLGKESGVPVKELYAPVSYTHLTLPTNREV